MKQAKSKQVQRFSLFFYVSTYYEKANVVTIVILAILAAISLSAVIGEDGIIFQAKDTKSMIENETQYDSEQLASMQGDLRDNSIYSGIGIVPGTDLGGSSEGGEGGTGNTGGTGGNSHGGSTTGGGGGATTGGMLGEDAVPPTITVLEGEEIAASFFRSDVTLQIATLDKTLKIKYVLTTTVDEINKELYPSGLVREIDIENGGTLTFTKAGEYTLTAATYDVNGARSNSTVKWFKIDKGGIAGTAQITVDLISGVEGNKYGSGANDYWYTSNVTYRVLGTDTGSTNVKYRVVGTAYDSGYIGNGSDAFVITNPSHNMSVDTGEMDIANGTTFRIAVDGEFTITAYSYAGGMRLSTSQPVVVKRDATRPFIASYTGNQELGEGFRVSVNAVDYASKLTAGNSYTYQWKESMSQGGYTTKATNQTSNLYTGLAENKTYDMFVSVIDQAGNVAASDIIVKPSLWISQAGDYGENKGNGIEGNGKYYRSDIELKMKGQDFYNVDISKTTYEILGTTTSTGTIDGITRQSGEAISGENIIGAREEKTINLAADGNWIVKIRNYNKEGTLVSTNIYDVTRDTEIPSVTGISISNIPGTVNGTKVTFNSSSKASGVMTYTGMTFGASGMATNNGMQYSFGDEWYSLESDTITYNNILGTPVIKLKDRAGNEGFSAGRIDYGDNITSYEINYTGSCCSFALPVGNYKFEVWGAAGGVNGGKGGHSLGEYHVTSECLVAIYVGGAGGSGTGGYNGGGSAGSGVGGGGGGTDIRISGIAFKDRVIVAGGGGGGYSGAAGGNGGGEVGENGKDSYGGTQVAGGGGSNGGGGFGFGGRGRSDNYPGAGGGGGWYGGGGTNACVSGGPRSGSGGSGYIGGVTNGSTQSGIRSGNGYAVITKLN